MSKKRLVALYGGGDWFDASVDFLIAPPDLDIEEALKDRERWYNEEYRNALHAGGRPKFYTESEWLKERYGCTNGYDELEHAGDVPF